MSEIIKNNAESEEVKSSATIEEVEAAENEEITAASEDREFVTLTDENGVDIEFEIIGRMSIGNKDYIALMAEDNDENYLILRREIEDGEETYVTIEDDDEFDTVADAFDDEFMSEIDFDFGLDSEEK